MTVQYGIIGAGVRAQALLTHLTKNKKDLFLKAICDVSTHQAENLKDKFGCSDTVCSNDYLELLNDPEISWVIVCSPNQFHKEHIIAAFQAGKHVFAEKPLATSIDDCVAINDAHKKNPELMFATGFVLRYSPLYKKVKELLDSGVIGDVVAVEANENLPAQHGGHIMTCWRRHKDLSGSHILEKCCHDMDLLNWFVGSLPVRVASFGGLDVFVPKNKSNLKKFPAAEGKESVYLEWYIPSRDTQNPFSCEKSIIDNQIAILEYQNNVRVIFMTTLNNSIPERRMYFSGTEGTLIAELYSGKVEVRRIGHGEKSEILKFASPDGHGGGDEIIAGQLAQSMLDGILPICGGDEGLKSAVVSLALEEARVGGNIIDLQPVWKKLVE